MTSSIPGLEVRARGGRCPMKNLEILPIIRTQDCSIQKPASINACTLTLFGGLKADQHKVCELMIGHCPPSCLPGVMYMTKSPRPSPSVFAYCKWLKTEVGTA